jgi:hypothetical protein
MEHNGFVPADHNALNFVDVGIETVHGNETQDIIPNAQHVFNRETNESIKVHSSQYQLVPYEDFYKGVEEALRESDLDLSEMHVNTDMTANGGRIFRQYLLPNYQRKVGGHQTSLSIITKASYDGSCANVMEAGHYEFLCANLAKRGVDIAIERLIHKGTKMGISEKIHRMSHELIYAVEQWDEDAKIFERWNDVEVSHNKVHSLLEKEKPFSAPANRDYILRKWLERSHEHPTLGGLHVALTNWATHYSPNQFSKPSAQTRDTRRGNVHKLEKRFESIAA